MISTTFDSSGRAVLITGAATGLGRATARAFAKAGGAVVIGDVDPRAEETVKLIADAGGRAISLKTDVTESAQVKALVDCAVQKFGGLDIAFNIAGLLPPTAPFVDQTEADWHKITAVDVTGVFLAMKHQLAHMVKAGKGVIINTAFVRGCVLTPSWRPMWRPSMQLSVCRRRYSTMRRKASG